MTNPCTRGTVIPARSVSESSRTRYDILLLSFCWHGLRDLTLFCFSFVMILYCLFFWCLFSAWFLRSAFFPSCYVCFCFVDDVFPLPLCASLVYTWTWEPRYLFPSHLEVFNGRSWQLPWFFCFPCLSCACLVLYWRSCLNVQCLSVSHFHIRTESISSCKFILQLFLIRECNVSITYSLTMLVLTMGLGLFSHAKDY